MAKVINLKLQEDITSVVERLWETGEEEVYLVLSKDSSLLKNIIAMKLLKREADRLGKEVVLITKDALGREMAKRVGLASRVSLPKSKALELKEEAEREQEVFREVPPQKFENLLKEEVKTRRANPPVFRQFSDIRPKGAIVERRSVEIEQKEEKITLPPGEGAAEEGALDFNEAVQSEKEEDSSFKDFYFPKKQKDQNNEEELTEEQSGDFFDESEKEKEDKAEDFSINEMVDGSRRKLTKEKKSFFSWLSIFHPSGGRQKDDNFKKVKETVKLEKRKKRPAVPVFSGKFLGLFMGAALLVSILALYFILPKAEISVSAKTEAISQDLNIIADKSASKIDASVNKVPAQLIKLDKRQSQEFSTTGQRQVNDKAKGMLTIYNEYSSSPQVLVEKTRFISEGGQTFRLIKPITVPGAKIQEGKIVASSIEAEVVADQPGESYNVGPGRFTIPGFQGTPKYAAFYGQSKSAMSGGSSGLMKVVTQDDYDKAKNDVWQSLQPALDKEFKEHLTSGLKMIDGATKEEINALEINPAVGSPAEKFTMTVKGTATAVLFDEKDILEVIKKKIAEKLADDKELAPDQIDYQLTSIDYSRGQIAMKVKAAGNIVWKINEDGLKQEIMGQNEKAIRDIFANHSEISEAKVVFWPFWVRKAPDNLDKVIIKVVK